MARPKLQDQLERTRIQREIAENKLRTKYLNYQNDNLKGSRKRTLGITTPGKPERDMSSNDRRRGMAMARQRVEENPLVQALLMARLDNIVGSGPKLMMRSGDIDWDTEVENWWKLEQDRLDIRGISPFGWLCRMWQARHDVDGDVGIALVADEFENIPLSYCQTFEADHITKNPVDKDDSGIDFDQYGMPLRYYVRPDLKDLSSDPVSFDAKNFILFRNDNTYRPSRARGITMFLQSFNLLQDHADIIDGIVQKVKNESFIGLKFWMQPGGDGNLFGSAQSVSNEEGVDYSQVEMKSGMNLVLGEGEQADVLESKTPHAEFDEFEKKLVSRIALPFGFTYELLTGDYSAMNDRTARVMLKQFEKRIRVEQRKLGMLASRIFRWSLSRAVKGGVITPPAGSATWFNHQWGYPGFPYINVLQETQANILKLENKLTSRTKILATEGDDDFEDLLDEHLYEEQAATARQMTLDLSTPALQEDAT